MPINRKLAIKILKNLSKRKNILFPFIIVCKEYSDEDNEFVEIQPNEWKNIKQDWKYQTFELWENINKKTLKLMYKSFIKKIK